MEMIFIDSKIEKFITSLEKRTIAKVLRTFDLLKEFGSNLGMPHSKPIKKGLFELRIRGEQEVRIVYVFHDNRIILLHGFLKKTNKIPENELKTAIKKKELLD